ncbi:MAG: DUF1028 domain-containing protein [Ectothiorhodospiraceae bacterium]|nr:DUF1028 domain-containing protein [Ectothiorhodospiraceae bacterium]
MTFSVAGICRRSGRIGFAVTTSSMAVGARVGAAAAGRGVVFSQARTDPRLHRPGLEAVSTGASADAALERMLAAATQPEWRQLGVLLADGSAAFHTGAACLPWSGARAADDCLAIGNFLAGPAVVDAMVEGFHRVPSAPLAERLVEALAAGERAGSERDPLRSAAVQIHAEQSFAWMDLRVDDDPDPIGALRGLATRFAGKADAYTLRALDPGNAPDSHDIEHDDSV